METPNTDTLERTSLADRRRATEAHIVRAFERVLRRDGVRSVGVNNVVKEARVGKGLIYKYFGGLTGLARAWIARKRIWPDFQPLVANKAQTTEEMAAQIKAVLRQHAEALRQEPLALEVLVEELMRPTELTESFDRIRTELGEEYCTVFQADAQFSRPENKAVLLMLYAAVTYLAMRGATAPNYMGHDLSQDKDWQAMLAMVDLIVDRAAAGPDR